MKLLELMQKLMFFKATALPVNNRKARPRTAKALRRIRTMQGQPTGRY